MKKIKPKRYNIKSIIIASALVILSLYMLLLWQLWQSAIYTNISSIPGSSPSTSAASFTLSLDNKILPSKCATDENPASPSSVECLQYQIRELKKRIKFAETKLNSYLSFGHDPFAGVKRNKGVCHNKTYLKEFCEQEGCVQEHKMCLDEFLPFGGSGGGAASGERGGKPCIVYDFGIRAEPEFGEILSKDPFHCMVYAFDPSEKSLKWYETSELKDNPNYNFFNFGVGGEDGNATLYQYNWNQVTMYRYPNQVVDPTQCDEYDRCRYKRFTPQKIHSLPLRSISSLMSQFNHTHITILKLDVEGSEYRALENLIESGLCRRVDQITLEWHHFGFDVRYGTSSNPHLNVIVGLLDEFCGLKQFWVYDKTGGWPAHEKIYKEMGVTLRYNLASFKRVREVGLD